MELRVLLAAIYKHKHKSDPTHWNCWFGALIDYFLYGLRALVDTTLQLSDTSFELFCYLVEQTDIDKLKKLDFRIWMYYNGCCNYWIGMIFAYKYEQEYY